MAYEAERSLSDGTTGTMPCADPEAIRVVLADRQPLVLLGVQHLLSQEPGFAVLASCRNAKQCLEAMRATQPDILVLDLHLHEQDAFEMLRTLVAEGSPVKVLVLTESIEEKELIQILRLGVRGVMLKEMAPQQLTPSLRKIHAGGDWYERQSFGSALRLLLRREDRLREVAGRLTPREFAIARLVARGLDNPEIARRLSIAEGTVKLYLHRIYAKLGVKGRLHLVLLLQESGLF
jgi:DNA-binding NarL/FixJ family response regulator